MIVFFSKVDISHELFWCPNMSLMEETLNSSDKSSDGADYSDHTTNAGYDNDQAPSIS